MPNRLPSPASLGADLPAFGLLGSLCMVASWLIPNHYQPWNWFYNDAAMALALAFLAAAAWQRRLPVGLTSAAWCLAAVAMLPWLQWGAGLLAFSGDAWVGSFYLLCIVCALGAGKAWARASPRGFAALLASAALAAALLSSVLALLQCLQLGDGGIWMIEIRAGDRANGNLGQPNNMATVMAFGVVGLWLLFEQRRIGGLAAASVLLLLLIGAALTQSRTAMLFGPALCLLRLAAGRRLNWRAGTGIVIAATAAHLALTLAWPTLNDALLLGHAEGLAERAAVNNRLEIWPLLIDAVWQQPWAGYGWLQTGAAQFARADQHGPVGELFLHGHNLFLDLLVWCGIPLGLTLIGLLLFWFGRGLQRAGSVEAAMGLAVITVFGIHSMLELPHHYLFFLIPVGLWGGVVEASVDARVRGASEWAALLALATAAIGLGLARDYPSVEADFRLMRFETQGYGAVRGDPAGPDAPMLSGLTAALREARTPVRSGMSTSELEAMGRLVRRYPYSPAIYRYAKALALNGRLAEARQAFVKLHNIHSPARYRQLRRVLHQEVAEGQAGLAALDVSVPP